MTRAILTYHSIDDSGSPISLAPSAFSRHVDWLASGHTRVLALDEIAGHPADEGDAVAVTFDDGFLNTRSAVERLLDHGIPVTLFVVSGQVGGANAWERRSHGGIPTLPLLGWDDLEFLRARGAAIESHTQTHAMLRGRPAAAIDHELQRCQADLEARLGVRSRHLAYPYGEVDHLVAERAARSFAFAYTTDYRCLASTNDPLRIPRLDMYYFQAPGSLDAWGTPAFDRRVAWIRARRKLRTWSASL